MTVTVRDNPAENCYEVYDDDQLAGFSDYKLAGTIAFTRNEVDLAFARRGLAKELVTAESRAESERANHFVRLPGVRIAPRVVPSLLPRVLSIRRASGASGP
jgi:predicted GNAT family acetyltransferase